MLPLSIFLIIWLVLLGIFAIMALLSVAQMLRFAIAGPMVTVSTGLFLIVSLVVIVATGLYLTTVDWTLTMDIGSSFSSSPYITP